ncbi:hypothetical protein HYX58_04800 [Candidatus Dependentiae bacterium]|nr:hypothetical protein [Candidatus Dependentiae bacterium]
MSSLQKLRTVGLIVIAFAAFQLTSAHDEGPVKAETNSSLIGIRIIPQRIIQLLQTVQKFYMVKAETREEIPPFLERPLIKSLGVKLAPSN